MINQLDICNFQSHKESHLDFHPGVNVLIGSSDAGKSAIIRSIRWAVWNRPNTDSFRSWWGGETAAALHLPEGQVARTKSNKFNRYTTEVGALGSDFKGLTFDAIKTEIPEEVSEILNMDDVNIQRQFARAFLLDSSPGEVAQHFNRVANLDKIDSSNKNVQTWLRSIQSDITSYNLQLSGFEAELIQYKGLEELETRLAKLEEMQKEVNRKTASKTQIDKMVYEIRIADVEISRQDKILSLEPELIRILSLIEQCKVRDENRNALQVLSDKISALDSHIEQMEMMLVLEPELNRILKRIEQRRVNENDMSAIRNKIIQARDINKQLAQLEVIIVAESNVVRILDWIKSRDEKKEQIQEVKDILRTIRGTDQDIDRQIEWLDQAQKEFQDEFPETCPLCGKPK
jgi:exonuclease SbcC